jgi:(E)-benzylidenesuccinyl-CoA hydratase
VAPDAQVGPARPFDDIPGVTLARSDSIALITIDRPQARNALTLDSQVRLIQLWKNLQTDDEVRAVVITGADDPSSPPERQSFCVGTDMKELADISGRPTEYVSALDEGFPSLCALEARTPSIAAVNGYCIGGGMTLMLATDLRTAAPSATFGLPEVPLGMIPANGAIPRMMSALPRAAGMQLLLLPQRMDAARALELGLINAVVPHGQVLSTALEWAAHIASLPATAVRAAMDFASRSRRLAPADAARLESIVLETLRQEAAVIAGPPSARPA